MENGKIFRGEGQNIVYLTKSEAEQEIPRVAAWCAEKIKSAAGVSNDTPPGVESLLNAAYNLSVYLAKLAAKEEEKLRDLDFYGCEGGFLAGEELGLFASTVFVELDLPPKRLVRVLTHELATHLQRVRVGPALFGADVVMGGYGVDGQQMRHRIARLVETIIFGNSIICYSGDTFFGAK